MADDQSDQHSKPAEPGYTGDQVNPADEKEPLAHDHELLKEEQSEASPQSDSEPKAEESEPVSELEQLAALQAELNKAKDESLRTQAEMQNLRRRTERDIEHAHKFALEKFVNDLLPVVDNLERAIAAIDPQNDAQKAIGEGVELTLKSFVDVLTRFDVEPVDPKGAAFNLDQHQAMSMLPSNDVPPNTVLEVFQKGYTLNGRLVRPAMVVVAKAADS